MSPPRLSSGYLYGSRECLSAFLLLPLPQQVPRRFSESRLRLIFRLRLQIILWVVSIEIGGHGAFVSLRYPEGAPAAKKGVFVHDVCWRHRTCATFV